MQFFLSSGFLIIQFRCIRFQFRLIRSMCLVCALFGFSLGVFGFSLGARGLGANLNAVSFFSSVFLIIQFKCVFSFSSGVFVVCVWYAHYSGSI